MKTKLTLIVAAAIILSWCNIAVSAEFPAGVYNSDYGKVSFVCRSYENCIGTYTGTGDGNPAKIIGKYSFSGQMSGYWIETASSKKCSSRKEGSYYWGRIDFRFANDANSWVGYYSYCGDEPSTRNKWNGWR